MTVRRGASAHFRSVHRLVLAALVGVAGVVGPRLVSESAVAPPATGLPIFRYDKTASGPLPWNAVSMSAQMAGTTMAGAPRVTPFEDLAFLTWRSLDGRALAARLGTESATTVNLSALTGLPIIVDDPWYAIDSSDNQHVLGTDVNGHLQLASLVTTPPYLDAKLPGRRSATLTVQRDLTDEAGVTFVGTPDYVMLNDIVRVIGRTATNHLVALFVDVSWRASAPLVLDITSLARDAGVSGSPIWLPSGRSVAVNAANGSLSYYQLPDGCVGTPSTCTSVSTTNLTTATGAPLLTSPLSATALGTGVVITGLTASGSAIVITGTLSGSTWTWNDVNVSTLAGAPALAGRPFVAAVGTTITVAATAANWNDLFALSNDGPGATWRDVDVSATGGSQARTVGGGIAGAVLNGSLILFAGGVNSPAPTGTGVYAIPESKNAAAITDKWPSIGITGALGTSGSPWVATKTSLSAIRYSQDFLVGKAINDSHVRTTWLSFWTVSGPASNEPVDAASYYKHGYVAGKAVATQIGTYRSLGLGLKPDWVIIDPEGYPDYHSCLDGTTSLAPWCPPWNPKLWAAYANGWAAGLEEIDPTLNAGIYASQNEYKNGGLAGLSMPVFVAVAFKWFSTSATAAIPVGATSVQVASSAGLYANQKFYIRDPAGPEFLQIASTYNGTSLTVPLASPTKKAHNRLVTVNGISPPLRLSSTVGSNIIGYTAFGSSNACLAVPWQIQLFNQPPWSGLYNTLQFDGGIYCRPNGT